MLPTSTIQINPSTLWPSRFIPTNTLCNTVHARRSNFTQMHHPTTPRVTPATTLLFNVNRFQNVRQNPRNFDSDLYMLQHENDDDATFDDGVLVNLRSDDIPSCWWDCFDGFHHMEFELVGSCNGLVCLAHRGLHQYEPAMVFNPLTGQHINLPRLEDASSKDVASGFGFDEVSNQYKVIRMVIYDYHSPPPPGVPKFKPEAEVYTLGSGRWRKIGDVPYENDDRYDLWFRRDSQRNQVFVNGSLHWLRERVSNKVMENILAFDVAKEEFQFIPLPPGLTRNDLRRFDDLWDLGRKLCLLQEFDDRCEIWVMEEYGVENSWTKEYVIPRQGPEFSEAHIEPITLMNNGNILVRTGHVPDSLFYFDPLKYAPNKGCK